MVDLYSGFDVLGKLLDVSSLRARVIAHNLANQNTPGFHKKDVRFEEYLKDILKKGKVYDILKMEPEVFEPEGGVFKPDGNNVVLEDELALNVKNHILFQVVTEALRWRFGMHNTALSERW